MAANCRFQADETNAKRGNIHADHDHNSCLVWPHELLLWAVSSSPRGTTAANEPSIEFDLINILKLTDDTNNLPVEEYEAIRSLEICKPRQFIDT